MAQKILIISQVYPYPLHDGGRVDVYNRLRALESLGASVTLVPFYNPAFGIPDTKPLEPLCKEIFPIPYLRRKLSKILSHRPYSIGSRENWKEIDPIISELQGQPFDLVITESHHVLTVAERFRAMLKIPRLVLRVHNNEPKFMLSLAKTSPMMSLARPFFAIEALKYWMAEGGLLKKMRGEDQLWHISFDEMERYKKRYPQRDHRFVPAALAVNEQSSIAPRSGRLVLFVGALFSPNNIHGLKWYLEHVHTRVLEAFPDYELVIAGNTKGADVKGLFELFSRFERVVLADTPEDLAPFYERAAVFINPMRHGAGVKLKTVEAAMRGVPIVTTSCGNEGTGFRDGEHLFVRDEPERFSEAIGALFRDKALGEKQSLKAALFLREVYDQSAVLAKLLVV